MGGLIAGACSCLGASGLRIGDPKRRPAQYYTHARHGALIATFIAVGEFILVERIVAHAQPERVKRRVAPVIRLVDWLEAARDDMLKIHGCLGSSSAIAAG